MDVPSPVVGDGGGENSGGRDLIFILTRPIMDLILAAVRHPGVRVSKQWWEQEGIDLVGIWEAEADSELGERSGEGAEGEMEN